MRHRCFRILLACLLPALLHCGAAQASTWPDKPVRILVGWAPGGATDVVARLIAQNLSESLGQQFVVENRPGAGGNIAAGLAAGAPADGYTLIFLTSAHAINATLYKNLGFDPVASFQPVAMVGFMTQLFVVNADQPFRSVGEVIAAAKSRPGQITFASAGSGSSSHLAMEQLQAKAGIDLRHIPYKGTSQYLPDLVAGRVEMAIDSSTALMPLVQKRQLRALAVSSSKRSQFFPDLPTIAEAGVDGYGVDLWFGFLGPAGIPADLLARMNDALRKVTASAAVVKKLNDMGLSVESNYTPGQFKQRLQADIAMYADIIKASGARVD